MCKMEFVLALLALCVGLAHSWDYAVSGGSDQISLFTNQKMTGVITIETRKIATLAYDEVHNMMLYVDKQTSGDIICGYDFASADNKCFTEEKGRNIHGLAYDPVTDLVFFTDTNERSVNWISLTAGTNNIVKGKFLIYDGTPRSIVVDSCKGYIYWLNTNLANPKIERARLNSTEREVYQNVNLVRVNANFNFEPHSLAIDQQSQAIYWMEAESTTHYRVIKNQFNGNDKITYLRYGSITDPNFTRPLNILAFSKKYCLFMDFMNIVRKIFEFTKYDAKNDHSVVGHYKSYPVCIVANYKVKDQIEGIQDCPALTRVQSVIENDGATFCVHGTKVNGQSNCKCAPGYTGERCDVSVCENYCLQGICSLNDTGLPECRCNAGYSGDRCEVYTCYGYCLNSGDCSLNEKSEPVCQCKGYYAGHRCEVSGCENYCIRGTCILNDARLPECRCNARYSGNRCEVDLCHGRCLNNGVCYMNEELEPACQCEDRYEGTRCETDTSVTSQTSQFSQTTHTNCSGARNVTLADLLSALRKPGTEVVLKLEEESNAQ